MFGAFFRLSKTMRTVESYGLQIGCVILCRNGLSFLTSDAVNFKKLMIRGKLCARKGRAIRGVAWR